MSRTVLIAEDSQIMRKVLIQALRSHWSDLAIVEAGDGKAAVQRYAAGGIDLILLDWNMPEMNGIDALRAIRAMPSEHKVPIIMVTTEGDREHVTEAILSGANHYIAKPFEPAALAERLGKFLGPADDDDLPPG